MVEKTLPPGLHVILGGSAGGIFRRVFHPPKGRLLVDNDVLSVGPTRACSSADEWNAMRRDFWAGILPSAISKFMPLSNQLIENASLMRDAERVVIWTATGLSEQLFVTHAIHLADQVGVSGEKLFIVQFESLPSTGARLFGTGELNEQNMSAHPEPQNPTPAMLKGYREAWTALTSSDPSAIEQFGSSAPDASPWLLRVMPHLLRRFPARHSGLPYWDRILLHLTNQRGPKASRIIGYAIAEYWDQGDPVGDWYLFGRMLRLASDELPNPLLIVEGDGQDMLKTSFRVTPFGLDVLEGRASNYPVNPIDDYAAGVRLSSRDGSLWFTDGERLLRGAG